jgi:hypothetical protein
VKQIRLMQQYQCGWTPDPKLIALEPPVFAICDDEDYQCLIQWLWYGIRGEYKGKEVSKAHAVVKLDNYMLSARRSLSDSRILTMQRVVMFDRTGDWSGPVYHLNGGGLDNRYENLTRKRPSRRRNVRREAALD